MFGLSLLSAAHFIPTLSREHLAFDGADELGRQCLLAQFLTQSPSQLNPLKSSQPKELEDLGRRGQVSDTT